MLLTTMTGLALALALASDIDPCELFPPDNIWNVPIDTLPVDPSSALYIQTIGPNTGLHPDFGTYWRGAPIGIPFVVVPHDQPLVDVTFDYDDESDPGPYPIPPNPPVEGGPESDGDRHILIVQLGPSGAPCDLWELFYAWPQRDGTWTHDERWDDDVLSQMSAIKGYQFEVVDVSSLMIDEDSGQALPPSRGDPDLNEDGNVNGADLTYLLADWETTSPSIADLDANGTVDAADLSILLAAWTPRE